MKSGGRVAVDGHDSVRLEATLDSPEANEFPPYGGETRVAIKAARRRPLLCRLHESHPQTLTHGGHPRIRNVD